MLGQSLAERSPQARFIKGTFGDHVGYQATAATGSFRCQYHHFANCIQLQEGILYFAQLNAVAAHFHLIVATAHKLDTAIGQPTCLVARTVDAVVSTLYRQGLELGSGELGQVHIAHGHAVSGNAQLAHLAHAAHSAFGVEDKGLGVVEGRTNRNRQVIGRTDGVASGVGYRLGRSVHVHQGLGAHRRQCFLHVGYGYQLPAKKKLAHSFECLHFVGHHRIEQGGGIETYGNPLLFDDPA